MPITIPHLVAYHSPQSSQRRRPHHDRHHLGRRGDPATNPFDFYLKPGDVVEAEIDRIGMLRNKVVSWEERTASRRRRT